MRERGPHATNLALVRRRLDIVHRVGLGARPHLLRGHVRTWVDVKVVQRCQSLSELAPRSLYIFYPEIYSSTYYPTSSLLQLYSSLQGARSFGIDLLISGYEKFIPSRIESRLAPKGALRVPTERPVGVQRRTFPQIENRNSPF